MNTSILISVSEHQLAELITDAVAAAMKQAVSQQQSSALPEKRQFFTRKELLEKLQISPSTLASWQKQGYVTPRRIGRRVYFDCTEIEHQLLSQTQDRWAGL